MKNRTEPILNLTVVFLLLIIGLLVLELRQAWRNERFLDATINKHTTQPAP